MTFTAICIPAVQSERPTYPSSKSRTKDWDKLEAEVKKEVLQPCPFYVFIYVLGGLFRVNMILVHLIYKSSIWSTWFWEMQLTYSVHQQIVMHANWLNVAMY